MLYAFELGRKKQLCHAELLAVLGEENLIETNSSTSIFELDHLNPQKLLDRLGGTIKVIEIVERLTFSGLEDSLQLLLKNFFKGHTGKIQFAFSLCGFSSPEEINIKHFLNFLKIFLKSLGHSSRFVNTNFENSKPAAVYRARVIEKGIDICLIKGKEENDIFLGRTIAIQNIDSYSHRDYDKPRRDAKIGMLPPKLAQIMINLALPDHSENFTATVYDPFCGTGTILTEALLMGHHAAGSDINPRMIEYSKSNCGWLIHEYGLKQPSPNIFQKDVNQLSKNDFPEPIDIIVTEGWLGTPTNRMPRDQERNQTFNEVLKLHSKWLKTVHPLLPKNAKVVLCLPAYRVTHDKTEHIASFDQTARGYGYAAIDTFLYDRSDQITAREIKVLQKI